MYRAYLTMLGVVAVGTGFCIAASGEFAGAVLVIAGGTLIAEAIHAEGWR